MKQNHKLVSKLKLKLKKYCYLEIQEHELLEGFPYGAGTNE